MAKELRMRQCQKIDTVENWSMAKNFVPMKGEIIVYQEVGSDDKAISTKIKIGDGKSFVDELSFLDEVDVFLYDKDLNLNQIKASKAKYKLLYLNEEKLYLNLLSLTDDKAVFGGVFDKTLIKTETTNLGSQKSQVELATKEDLEEFSTENIQWNQINNRPLINSGTAEGAIKIGTQAEAIGKNSISGGAKGSEIFKEIFGYEISNLPDDFSHLEDDLKIPSTAHGIASVSLGASSQAITDGSFSMGIASKSGVKGFYWWEIDFDKKTIQLSSSQKKILTSRSWNQNDKDNLSLWQEGDILSIHNGKNLYSGCSKIMEIDVAAGKIKVDYLPFTSTETSLIPGLKDYSVICINRPENGAVSLGFVGISVGLDTKAIGNFSRAYGRETIAVGTYSVSDGSKTLALGQCSSAHGAKTQAYGDYSYALGENSISFGEDSIASGRNSISFGRSSASIGFGANDISKKINLFDVDSERLLTEWNTTKFIMAKGDHSFAEGKNTLALGEASHAEGSATLAYGNCSHSSGYNTQARGDYSTSIGVGTIADFASQLVIGKYNDLINAAFVIGSGKLKEEEGIKTILRKNIFTVDWNGNTSIAGSLSVGSLNVEILNFEKVNANSATFNNIVLGEQPDNDINTNYVILLGNTIVLQEEQEGIEPINSSEQTSGYLKIFSVDTLGNIETSGGLKVEGTIEANSILLNGVAVSALGVGRASVGHNSEIFNNYNNNLAMGEYSHAEGYGDLYDISLTKDDSTDKNSKTTFYIVNNNDDIKDKIKVGNYISAFVNESIIVRQIVSYKDDIIETQRFTSGHPDSIEGQLVFNLAIGNYSHTEGYSNKTIGEASHAEGYNTTATQLAAHAEGRDTIAEKECSHSEGYRTTASGVASHVEGARADKINDSLSKTRTTASGIAAHAEGGGTSAIGNASHSEGILTIANGVYSHSEGEKTTANGQASHSEGFSSIQCPSNLLKEINFTAVESAWKSNKFILAFGQGTHAEGQNTIAYGDGAHAEGTCSIAKMAGSHAEGYFTQALGQYAHAEGQYSRASGTASHAEGGAGSTTYTSASATAAHAEGIGSKADGQASHAEGLYTQAAGNTQHVQGKYNILDNTIRTSGNHKNFTQYAHIVGNGTSSTNRSNAYTLDWDGNGTYAGTVEATGIILKSPNGKKFKITVGDDGTLSTAEL